MKHTLTFALLLFGSTAWSQDVIAAQGQSYANANGSIDCTIGEVVISTESDGTTDITQGFHQTNWHFSGLEDFAPSYVALVYPNPLVNELMIKTDADSGIRYFLSDANGRIVSENELQGEFTSIEVRHLAPGAYQLHLIDESQNSLKTFKLIKNQ
jgi:hypothetical protein